MQCFLADIELVGCHGLELAYSILIVITPVMFYALSKVS